MPSLRLAAVMGFVPLSWRHGRIGERWWLEGSSDHRYDEVVDVDWVIGAVHVIRTSALDGHPPYSERWFMYVEDLELCARMHAAGHRVVLDGDVTVAHVGQRGRRPRVGRTPRRPLARRDVRLVRARARPARGARVGGRSTCSPRSPSCGSSSRVHPDDRREPRTRCASATAAMRRVGRAASAQAARGTRLGRRPRASRPATGRAACSRSFPAAQVSGAEMVLLRDLTAARIAGWTVRCACTDGPLVEELDRRRASRRSRSPISGCPTGRGRSRWPRVALRSLVAAAAAAARRAPRRDRPRQRRQHAARAAHRAAARAAPCSSRTTCSCATTGFASPGSARPRSTSRSRCPTRSRSRCARSASRRSSCTTAPRGRSSPRPTSRPSPPVVGCSALLTEWKGQHVLLEAMTRVSRPDAVLELMGATLPKDGAVRGRARTPRGRTRPRGPRALPRPRRRPAGAAAALVGRGVGEHRPGSRPAHRARGHERRRPVRRDRSRRGDGGARRRRPARAARRRRRARRRDHPPARRRRRCGRAATRAGPPAIVAATTSPPPTSARRARASSTSSSRSQLRLRGRPGESPEILSHGAGYRDRRGSSSSSRRRSRPGSTRRSPRPPRPRPAAGPRSRPATTP